MKITGKVRIDLRPFTGFDGADDAWRALQRVVEAPPGSDVELVVAERQIVPGFARDWLDEHGRHVGSITVVCSDEATIRRWIRFLKEGAEIL